MSTTRSQGSAQATPTILVYRIDRLNGTSHPDVHLGVVIVVPAVNDIVHVTNPECSGRVARRIWRFDGQANVCVCYIIET